MSISRRQFISTSLAAGTAMMTSRRVSASDTLNIGLIGCNSQGYFDLANSYHAPGVKCVALCDVDDEHLHNRAQQIKETYGDDPVLYKDYRKLLDNKDVDMVIIGTPDHWHCLQFVHACQAGKDVYVEKPIANSIAECELMVQAAGKYNRVIQVGQQQRSGKHWQNAIDFIKSGQLGTIRRANVWANFHYGLGDKIVPDSPVPKGVDFDMWLGPAPQRTFNASRFHGRWRMFWDYGGGLMTDWGVHLLDMVLWALDIKGAPKSVTAIGGRFDSEGYASETPDTLNVLYKFDDLIISWENNAGVQSGPYSRIYGIAFMGTNGTLWIDRDSWEVIPEYKQDGQGDKMEKIPKQSTNWESHVDHLKNFVECVKTRNKVTAAPINVGYDAAFYAQIGNIAYRTGETLVWDEKTKSFGNNKKANVLLKPEYRAPWQWPNI